MIYLFTDFGSHDLYVGQVHAALFRVAPDLHVVDLLHEAPRFAIASSAHLLAALNIAIADDAAVIFAVVDPGVGGARRPIAMQADGRWFVGPDNGLLSIVAARAQQCRYWEILWRPAQLSGSFHGRDLFAPIAAMLSAGEWWPGALQEVAQLEAQPVCDNLSEVIYVDHYGNLLTGLRSDAIGHDAGLHVAGTTVRHAHVFSQVPAGTAFWYINSIGLVEIAVNCGNAARQFDVDVGEKISVVA